MASVFDTIKRQAGDRDLSLNWYKKKIGELSNRRSVSRLMRDGKVRKTPRYNRLHFFRYDPKLKATLPYYDMFPLVMPIQTAPGGFLGINFHYLPMNLRLKLLDRVVDFSNNTKFDKTTVIMAEYRKFKNIRELKPTLKRYLAGRVKTRYRRIDADEFTVATLLPIARWKKASAGEVYSDSRKMI